MNLKTLLSKTIVKSFKSCGVLGRQRFWSLYWAYRLWPGLHIRHKEWDYILEYLPKLHNEDQKVYLLDVGCGRNLISYEYIHRGYILTGIDPENFQEKFPGKYYKTDILGFRTAHKYDFVTCISVVEHIGNEGRGNQYEQVASINKMIDLLVMGGRLLLTIPTKEFAQGHEWKGFRYFFIEKYIKNGVIRNSVERAGQLCLCIERVS